MRRASCAQGHLRNFLIRWAGAIADGEKAIGCIDDTEWLSHAGLSVALRLKSPGA
jgi:hypothetical protein